MKLIKTADAVGTVLCHDITQIIPGKSKGPVFKKGHIVRSEDIPVLLSCGKEHLYVWEQNEDMLHENDAAAILRDICTGGSADFAASEPSEGKIEIRAAKDGLLKIDKDALFDLNYLGEMMIATIHGDRPVRAGERVAATRIIPLVIEKEKMERAKKAAAGRPILEIMPFRIKKAGIVTTGNEVFKGIIKDAFGPVLKSRLAEYGAEVTEQVFTPDDSESIKNAILDLVSKGAETVLVSGGMSVDPDDRTPGAIKAAGARIVTYGAPVLPGAMFLLSYLEYEGKGIPVMGLPGCVMYAKRTIFDLVLPRVLAGEELVQMQIAAYGEGGLCLGCEVCTFPHCGFGK
ncbi:MAG: molybdopterin-binding protein [Oscillospiraceae bacterium]|nr:molybdopterin-binding protein [Oscillospiraceae bacterium]